MRTKGYKFNYILNIWFEKAKTNIGSTSYKMIFDLNVNFGKGLVSDRKIDTHSQIMLLSLNILILSEAVFFPDHEIVVR